MKSRPQALDAGDALLRRDQLLRLGQLVRLVAALGAEDGGIALECGVGEQALGDVVLELAPFEVEEEHLGLDLRVPLAHLLHERAARLVGAVGRLPQTGIRLDSRRVRLDPLELGDGVVQLGCRQLAELAAETLAERARGGACLVELGLDPRVVRPLIEVREVPFDLLCAGKGGRHVLEPTVR